MARLRPIILWGRRRRKRQKLIRKQSEEKGFFLTLLPSFPLYGKFRPKLLRDQALQFKV